MNNKATRWIAPALFVGIGAAAGVLFTRARALRAPPSPAQALTAPPVEVRPPVVIASPARLTDADRAMLGEVVREQVRAALVAQQATTPDAGPKDEGQTAAERLTAPQMQAYDEARAMVGRRIEHGSWNDGDRAQLRPLLAGMPVDVRLEIVRPLIVAVNAGQVRFTGQGRLF